MLFRKFYPLKLYIFENLIDQKLTMSTPTKFNDPFDCALLRDDEILKNLKDFEKDLFNKIRILCLFIVDEAKKGYEETQRYFWSFYGDSHRGFCVEINIPDSDFKTDIELLEGILKLEDKHKEFNLLKEKMFSGKMDYHSDFINNIDTLKQRINRTDAVEILETGIFYKDNVFERENEFRIIKYADSNKSDFESFSIGKYNKKLIFGRKCPTSFKKMLGGVVFNDYELYEVNDNMEEVKYEKK